MNIKNLKEIKLIFKEIKFQYKRNKILLMKSVKKYNWLMGWIGYLYYANNDFYN